MSADSFGLVDEKALKDNKISPNSQILVRVVSWDNDGYVCQWMTEEYTDTQDYKLVR
jgi:hypothetical protein